MASTNPSAHDRLVVQAVSQTSLLATPTALPTEASPAPVSHQPVAPTPAMTNLNGFQRQQHELIKILAQHFHNQFYQLASTANAHQAQQFASQPVNQARPNQNNGTSNQQPPTIGSYQQQQQQQQPAPQQHHLHYHQAIQNLSTQPSTRLETDPFSQQQLNFLPDHLLRSQHHHQHQPHLSNVSPMGLAGAQNPPDTSSAEFSALNAATLFGQGNNLGQLQAAGGATPTSSSSSSYSPLNDLNFFNALGFNLLNNQLIVPPRQHQQHLIQAATSAVRQVPFDSSHCGAHPSPGYHGVHARDRTDTKDSLGNDKHLDYSPTTNNDRKELLKFSINTILGRRSPSSANGSPIVQVDNSIGHNEDLIDQLSNNDSNDARSNQLASDELDDDELQSDELKVDSDHPGDQQALLASECDTDNLDYGSDSGSSCRSPTAKANASILFNNQVSSIVNNATTKLDNRSATNHHQNLSALNNNTNPSSSGNNFMASVLTKTTHHHAPSAPTTNSRHQHQQQHQQQQHQQLTNRQSSAPGHPSLAFLTGSAAAAAAAAFPWTVAARGKPRRGMMRRAVFSDSQRVGLEKRFQLQKYISKPDRKKLAEKLGLRDSQVKIWFQNRRMKWRNSKERELLSAGGSREQTLPTRNNPNPDLSDVGETIKRLAASGTNGVPLSDGPPTNK